MSILCKAACLILLSSVFAEVAIKQYDLKKVDSHRSFTTGFGVFLKDGIPYQIISGAVHYFRVVPERWKMVLSNCRIAGLNTIETYVPWNLHFPTHNEDAHFDGILNLSRFLQTAKDLNLNVLLRIGPYVDAELDYGGLPVWLLSLNVSVRTRDPLYLKYVDEYLKFLKDIVTPYLYYNDGPIIMLQVENEYGSFGCDELYLMHLEDLFRTHFPNTLLFTTDGCSDRMISCGNGNKNTTLLPTVDFGPDYDSEYSYVDLCFRLLKHYSPGAPKICSEFYTGWFSIYDKPRMVTNINNLATTLSKLISTGVSVNMYMFMGGTNYGFMGGVLDTNKIITSYDYDGPLDQSGNPTLKFFEIQKILNANKKESITNKPYYYEVESYGSFPFNKQYNIFKLLPILTVFPEINVEYLPVLEYIHQYLGFTLFTTFLPEITEPMNLTITSSNDELIIINNDKIIASQKPGFNLSVLLDSRRSLSYLHILHKINGHNSLTKISDYKQIIGATLNGKPLRNWNVRRLDINKMPEILYADSVDPVGNNHIDMPTVVHVLFDIKSGPTRDTYLDLGSCVISGYVILNKFNLGYYSNRGPQLSLYVPSTVLEEGINHLFIFEFFKLNNTIPFKECKISFQNNPLWSRSLKATDFLYYHNI